MSDKPADAPLLNEAHAAFIQRRVAFNVGAAGDAYQMAPARERARRLVRR
jgi:hypothetical protein